MSKIKVAIIGCGTIANNAHIPAYLKSEDAEILYFCDIIPERADECVKKYGCGKAIYNYKEIVDDPTLNAVSVCTPNNTHAPISIDFMRGGKDVLCEKPAAHTYAEAQKMLAVQKETGRMLTIGVCNRFNDNINKIKLMIDGGLLGEVYQVYVSFRCQRMIPGLGGDYTTKAIAGGGALIDWGVHFLDIVMYCCGDPTAKTVTAETFSKLGADIGAYVYEEMWAGPPKLDGIYDVEEGITGLIRTNGPVITVNGAWAQNIGGPKEMYIDFMGDQGGVRLIYGKDFTFFSTKDGKLYSENTPKPTTNHYEIEINAFLGAIRSGKKLPSDISINIKTSQMMQALYDSAAQHRELEV